MSRDTLGVVLILVVAVLGAFFLTDWQAVWDWCQMPKHIHTLAALCWIMVVVCIVLLILPPCPNRKE